MAEGKQSRFDLIINAVERVSGPFRRIEQAMDGVRDRTEKARQALGRFSRVTGLQRLSGSIGNVRDKLQGMVGAPSLWAPKLLRQPPRPANSPVW